MNCWTAIKDMKACDWDFRTTEIMRQTRKIESSAWLFCLSKHFPTFLFPLIAKHTKGDGHAASIFYPHLRPQSSLLWHLISPWPPPRTEAIVLRKLLMTPRLLNRMGVSHFLCTVSYCWPIPPAWNPLFSFLTFADTAPSWLTACPVSLASIRDTKGREENAFVGWIN